MPPSPLLEATFGAMAAKTVYAAAELRLADLLARGLHSSQELAERTRTHAPSLRASPGPRAPGRCSRTTSG
jgi:orsellinic acid C2-O-methyltransferase